MKSTWSPALKCEWSKWSVERSRTLRLDLPKYNSCDMNGAVAMALLLTRDVLRINVYCDTWPDISYILDEESDKWEAFNMRKTDD